MEQPTPQQPPEPIAKVAIVDDEKMFLQLLGPLVNSFPGVTLCWTARDGEEAIQKIASDPPSLMLIDFDMPRMNGLELVRHLRANHPAIGAILLTSHADDQTIFDLFNEGVKSYLVKYDEVTTIQKAIDTVRQGDEYFPGYVYAAIRRMNTRQRRQREMTPATETRRKNPLTKRETEVLRLLCKSYNNPDIAEELGISVRTVETYRSKIIEKAGSDNLFGAAMEAIKNDWIDWRED